MFIIIIIIIIISSITNLLLSILLLLSLVLLLFYTSLNTSRDKQIFKSGAGDTEIGSVIMSIA